MNTAATVSDKGCTRNTSGWLNNWSLIPEAQLLCGGRADLGASGGANGDVACVSYLEHTCAGDTKAFAAVCVRNNRIRRSKIQRGTKAS
jgi:hypothetical protein